MSLPFSTANVFVIERAATEASRNPSRYTVHISGVNVARPAHLVAFERRADANAFHHAMARFWNEKRRMPMLWSEIEDMVDQFYWTSSAASDVNCPIGVRVKRIPVDDVAEFMSANSLSCLSIRSIQHKGGRYLMTYAFLEVPESDVDIDDQKLAMECLYFMS